MIIISIGIKGEPEAMVRNRVMSNISAARYILVIPIGFPIVLEACEVFR
jgi:hypothetical protein